MKLKKEKKKKNDKPIQVFIKDIAMKKKHQKPLPPLPPEDVQYTNHTTNFYRHKGKEIYPRIMTSTNYGGKRFDREKLKINPQTLRSTINKYNWCEGSHIPHKFSGTLYKSLRYAKWKKKNNILK